jgi:hypothetical protein
MKYVFYFELIFIYDTIKVTHSLLTNIAIKNTCCIFLIDDSLERRARCTEMTDFFPTSRNKNNRKRREQDERKREEPGASLKYNIRPRKTENKV